MESTTGPSERQVRITETAATPDRPVAGLLTMTPEKAEAHAKLLVSGPMVFLYPERLFDAVLDLGAEAEAQRDRAGTLAAQRDAALALAREIADESESRGLLLPSARAKLDALRGEG